jgi:hypothetical protein
MSENGRKKLSVTQLFKIQAAATIIIVAPQIVLGAFLVFVAAGETYSQFTAIGFVATVYFAFIAFLPAGTLFGARLEFIRGNVAGQPNEQSGATQPIANPLLHTLPLGLMVAAALTGIVAALVYGLNWRPSPAATTLFALLFAIPYVVIVRRTIFRDIEGLAAMQPPQGERVAPRSSHVWAMYIIPNIVFQSIIAVSLAVRTFSHEADLIADRAGPGFVPVEALVPDFAITFAVICCFTFLGAVAHAASDIYEGTFSAGGRGRGINGFLYFLLLLLMGIALGFVVAVVATILKIAVMPFAIALLLKFFVICLAVHTACWLAIGWVRKRWNDRVQKAAA